MIIDVDFRTFSASKFLACTKTRVGRSLTCCNEKSIKVLGDPLILGVKRSKVKVKKYKSGAGVGLSTLVSVSFFFGRHTVTFEMFVLQSYIEARIVYYVVAQCSFSASKSHCSRARDTSISRFFQFICAVCFLRNNGIMEKIWQVSINVRSTSAFQDQVYIAKLMMTSNLCPTQQLCRSSLLSGWNVRWPRRVLPLGVTLSMCRELY